MNLKTTFLFLILSLQVACRNQSFSYPVIADVSKVEVVNRANIPVTEIKDSAQIDKIVRFIDERRTRWCAPRLGSLPAPNVTLNFYVNNDGKGTIGLGDRFFVAQFSGGKFKMDISEAEEQEFLKLLGASKDQVFGR